MEGLTSVINHSAMITLFVFVMMLKKNATVSRQKN